MPLSPLPNCRLSHLVDVSGSSATSSSKLRIFNNHIFNINMASLPASVDLQYVILNYGTATRELASWFFPREGARKATPRIQFPRTFSQ